MGFSIELDEDTARRLFAEAARRNVEPEELGREIVRDRVCEAHPHSSNSSREERVARLKDVLAEIEEFGRRNPMPSLPDEALTREALCADHD